MELALEFIQAIAVEFVAVLLSLVLAAALGLGRNSHGGGSPASAEVTYGIGLKAFAAITLIGCTGTAAVLSSSALEPNEQWMPWFALGMGAAGAYMVWETFLCRHGVTRLRLNHRSPWRGRYEMPWADVRKVALIPSMYVIALEDVHGNTRWVGLMMSGLSQFADRVLANVPREAISGKRTEELLRRLSSGELPDLL